MMSKRTKSCKTAYIFFSLAHFLLLVIPLLIAIPKGFQLAQGSGPKQIALTFSLISAICMGLISVFIDLKYREGFQKSILWLVLIGLAIALNNIKTLLIWIAVLSIIDELIVVRLKDSYKRKYLTNKEIDLRG